MILKTNFKKKKSNSERKSISQKPIPKTGSMRYAGNILKNQSEKNISIKIHFRKKISQKSDH